MKYALTCIAGLEAFAKKEIENCGGKILDTKDRIIFFEGTEEEMVRVNLWSRIGNKLYAVLGERKNTSSFDDVFDAVSSVRWRTYISKPFPIIVNAKSIKSSLTSIPALQGVGKKAIVTSLCGKKDGFVREDDALQKFEIMLLIMEEQLFIMLNTSGDALHKRGYRIEAGEAPIKENLASALVRLSRWRYEENLYDPFCGSGTLAIEAVLMAKNRAPGLERHFAFERRSVADRSFLEEEKEKARQQEYTGTYQIYASDKDPEMIAMAKRNAANAGVGNDIHFEVRDFYDFAKEEKKGTLVSNPPYGKRLEDSDIHKLYTTIDTVFQKNKSLGGGIITSYEDFSFIADKKHYKNRKLYNGNELCYFYSKNMLFSKSF